MITLHIQCDNIYFSELQDAVLLLGPHLKHTTSARQKTLALKLTFPRRDVLRLLGLPNSSMAEGTHTIGLQMPLCLAWFHQRK